MLDLLYNSFALPNILPSILLSLMLLYWMSVIIGAIGMDSFDVDFDVDVDVDIDVDIDVDVDVDVDVDADISQGILIGMLKFFNFGKIPFMILMTILMTSIWAISVYCNNPESLVNPTMSLGFAGLLAIPNFIVSLFITKFFSSPLVPVFEKLDTAAKPINLEGKIGILTTSMNKDGMAQMKINVDGSIISVSVRSEDEDSIKKGERVMIIQKDLDNEKQYIIQRFNH